MDALDLAMREAERLGFGVSYGKYKAAHPNGSGDVLPKKMPEQQPLIPQAVCKHCGQPFVPDYGRQKHCSQKCADATRRMRQAQYDQKRANAKRKSAASVLDRVCIVCGADFKTKDHRKTICSGECSAERRRQLAKAWHAARRKDG